MLRIGHTADWHLGAAGTRHHRNGLSAALMDRYECAKFAVNDAVERGAELILVAGDVFNGWRPTPTEVRLAKRALEPATRAGIEVVMLKGNHDDVRTPTEEHALDLLRDTSGLCIVDHPKLLNVWRKRGGGLSAEPLMQSPADGAELELQIACLPWPNLSLLLRDEATRALDPGQRNLRVRELLMDVARGLATERIKGVPAVLLGHFSVDVAAAGAQDRLMLLGGDWTLNLQEIEALGFDAVMLGHIHKGQHLGSLAIWYSGSPEACSFSEEGEEKFYLLHTPTPDASRPGEWFNLATQRISTPYRRLVTLNAAEPLPEIPAGAIVRLQIPAAWDGNLRELHAALEQAGATEVRVETQHAETHLRRETGVSEGMGHEDALKVWLAQRPELHPLTEAILRVAVEIEGELGEGRAM